jgi:hypothetical protein
MPNHFGLNATNAQRILQLHGIYFRVQKRLNDLLHKSSTLTANTSDDILNKAQDELFKFLLKIGIEQGRKLLEKLGSYLLENACQDISATYHDYMIKQFIMEELELEEHFKLVF